MFTDNTIYYRAKIQGGSEPLLKTCILIGVVLVVTLAYVPFSQEVYAVKVNELGLGLNGTILNQHFQESL